MDTQLPAPQASFAGLNSAQWKSGLTILMATALGPIIEKGLKWAGIGLTPDSAADLLVLYGPTVAGIVITVLRRAHDYVLNDVVKILVARGQHTAAAVVQEAAQQGQKPTGATLLPSWGTLALLGAVLPFLGGLAACTTAPDGTKHINAPTVATVSADVNLIATGLGNAVMAFSGVPISTDTLNIAQASLASIRSAASEINSASSTAAAQPLVAQIQTYVNAFAAAVAKDPSLAACTSTTCSQIKGYVAMANLLLPVIEIGVNMVVPQQPSPAAADAARATLAAPAVAK